MQLLTHLRSLHNHQSHHTQLSGQYRHLKKIEDYDCSKSEFTIGTGEAVITTAVWSWSGEGAIHQ